MESLKFETLEIRVEQGDPVVIKWIGISQSRNPAAEINPYIEKLAEMLKGRQAIVDFRELEYMNSSTAFPIVNLCKVFDKKQIQTTIKYDKTSEWQGYAFRAIIMLSRMTEYISVEACGPVGTT